MKHRLGTVSKNIFTGGLKLVLWYQPHPYFRCGSRQIDVWFARKIPKLSIQHFNIPVPDDNPFKQIKGIHVTEEGITKIAPKG